jgi:hypothetical protein
MARFYLYRIVLTEVRQPTLFGRRDRAKALYEAFHAKPSMRSRGAVMWHVGNVEDIDEDSVYFRIGRTGRAIEPRFNDETSDFIDTEAENAPYTHGFCHFPFQLCALATNAKLAPNAKSIASRLEMLLRRTPAIQSIDSRLELGGIQDPESFIDAINVAYAVTRFSVGFGLPNPIDADEDFEKPMQRYLSALGGRRGVTTVSSVDDLDREVMGQMARAAASRGNKASAVVREHPGAAALRKKLEGNPASLDVRDVPQDEDRRKFVADLIATYVAIRGSTAKQ